MVLAVLATVAALAHDPDPRGELVTDLGAEVTTIAQAFAPPRPYVVAAGFGDFAALKTALVDHPVRSQVRLRRLTTVGSAENDIARLAARACVVVAAPSPEGWRLRGAGECSIYWGHVESEPVIQELPPASFDDLLVSRTRFRQAQGIRTAGAVITPFSPLVVGAAVIAAIHESPSYEPEIGLAVAGISGLVVGTSLLTTSAFQHHAGIKRLAPTRTQPGWLAVALAGNLAPFVALAVPTYGREQAAFLLTPGMFLLPYAASMALRQRHRAVLREADRPGTWPEVSAVLDHVAD